MKRVLLLMMICLLMTGMYAQQQNPRKVDVVNKEQSNVEAKKPLLQNVINADFSAKTGALQATERVQKPERVQNYVDKNLKAFKQSRTQQNRQLPLNLRSSAKAAPVFTQNFDGSTTNCSFVGGDCPWAIGTDLDYWYSDYAYTTNSTNYAYIDDDECDGDLSDAWLIISGINLSTVASPVLNFEALYMFDGIPTDLTVKVSTNGGTSWTDLAILPENPTLDDYGLDWVSYTYLLSGCENQANVSIAFHFNDLGDWVYGWAVDNIAIYDYEDYCMWTITGEDDFGDGWNGGYLEIVQSGVPSFIFAVTEETATFTFPVMEGQVDFVWHAGAYDDEVSFEIINFAGSTVYSVTADYPPTITDGQTVYTTTNDCVVPSSDASITAITAPVSGINLTATETVTATIKNNGLNVITPADLELKLTVDDIVIATEPYTGGNIAAGATANYTFTTTADLSAAGAHTITVRAILDNDANIDNDSQTITVYNIVTPIAYAADAYVGDATNGTYNTLNVSTGQYTQINTLSTTLFPIAEAYDNQAGIIYRLLTNSTLGVVSADGSFVELGMLTGGSHAAVSGIAYNTDNNTLYLLGRNSSYAGMLYSINVNTLALTLIGTTTAVPLFRGFEYANDGYFYAIGQQDNTLYKINPATGAETAVGAIGITIGYAQELAFDKTSNRLYTYACDGSSSSKYGYYNLTTGAFTLVYDNTSSSQVATIVILSEPTGIPTNAISNFNIYPNPTSDKLTVDNMEDQFNTIEIYNIFGQVIYRAAVTGNQAQIDVAGYSTGMYYVKLQGDNGMVTKKFVKK